MEELIRKIVREELARAFQAVADVSAQVEEYDARDMAKVAAENLKRTMQRVAVDVLADTHPVLDTEHTRVHTVTSVPARRAQAEHAPDDACTCGHDRYRHRSGSCFACDCQAFTPVLDVPVESEGTCPECHRTAHKLDCSTGRLLGTVVPEEPKAACTCHRHTHVMGQEDFCGVLGCFCRTPIRARTAEHTSTRMCTVCKHAPHEDHLCSATILKRDGWTESCECGGRS